MDRGAESSTNIGTRIRQFVSRLAKTERQAPPSDQQLSEQSRDRFDALLRAKIDAALQSAPGNLVTLESRLRTYRPFDFRATTEESDLDAQATFLRPDERLALLPAPDLEALFAARADWANSIGGIGADPLVRAAAHIGGIEYLHGPINNPNADPSSFQRLGITDIEQNEHNGWSIRLRPHQYPMADHYVAGEAQISSTEPTGMVEVTPIKRPSNGPEALDLSNLTWIDLPDDMVPVVVKVPSPANN